MPTPTIATVARVAVNWTHPDAGYAVNIWHFSGIVGYPDHADLASAINSNINSGQFNSIAEDAEAITLDIQDLDGSSAATTHSVNLTGGAAGDDPVPAACCLVKLMTALAGRSFRGRTYLPFTAEVSQANGLITSDVAGMNTAWNGFKDDMHDDGFDFVVASYKLESAELITSLLVETPMATQRRRQSRLR